MARPKGQPKLGGRQKGTPNKTTTAIKDMIVFALDRVGGVDYLEKQANDNPKAFLALLSRVLPLQVTGDIDAPLVVKVIRFSDVSKEAD